MLTRVLCVASVVGFASAFAPASLLPARASSLTRASSRELPHHRSPVPALPIRGETEGNFVPSDPAGRNRSEAIEDKWGKHPPLCEHLLARPGA
jgi:hypothetical protein